MNFPKKGKKSEDVLRELEELKKNDVDWKNGKSFGLVIIQVINMQILWKKQVILIDNFF